MGNSASNKVETAVLLKPAMEGDLDKIKKLVGTFLATYNSSAHIVGHVDPASGNPKLQDFCNQQDPEGNNAIHGAVFTGHLEIVKYLVEGCGASLTIANKLGCSPLWLAAGYDRVEVLKYILSTVSTSADSCKEALLQTNTSGDTPLIAAASRGNLESCKLLLREASKHDDMVEELMTTGNKNGDTPLKVTISIASQQTSTDELVDLLLEHATERVANTKNQAGLTPLLVACERDDAKLLQKLVDHKANVSVQDSTGASPLAVAAFCGSKDVLALLLEMSKSKDGPGGQLLEQPNANGCTPLWLAARTGRPEVVEMLLKAGADPTIANKEGISPIDVAAKNKREKVLALFQKGKEES
jgi:ankyrin repeat protein